MNNNEARQPPTSAVSAPATHPVEIALLTLLGLAGLCGLSGGVLSFTPGSEPIQANAAMALACSGLTGASLVSMAMIWFRRRSVPASAWLAMGVVSTFIGLNILGWGGFALLMPQESSTLAENIGFSLALCFTPGVFFTLLGAGLYVYDRRRQKFVGPEGWPAGKPQEAGRQPSQTEKLQRAAEYREHILKIIDQQGDAFAAQLTPIKNELAAWEKHLHELAGRLHSLEANAVIQRDMDEIPEMIDKLQARLERETDPQLRAEITEVLTGYHKHYDQLDALHTLMRRIELDIDETVVAIAGVYSQLQVLSAKGIDSNRAKRISATIEEQTGQLTDLLEAMDEVYADSTPIEAYDDRAAQIMEDYDNQSKSTTGDR